MVLHSEISTYLVSQIFGPGWKHLAAVATNGSAGSSAAGATSVILLLLGSLNAVALAIGTFMMSYVLAVGVIGTAHEGKPLGSAYHTLYTPVRSAAGIAMLAPVAKGLSILQLLILAAVAFSIHMTNTKMVDPVLTYLGNHHGQIVAHVNTTQITESGTKVAKAMLDGEVMEEYYHDKENKKLVQSGKTKSGFVSITPLTKKQMGNVVSKMKKKGSYVNKSGAGGYRITFNKPSGSGMPDISFGSILVPCSMQNGQGCKAIKRALVNLSASLHPIAQKIMLGNKKPSKKAYIKAINNYVDTLSQFMSTQIKPSVDKAYKKNLNKFVNRAKTLGWVGLGSWYWTLSGFNEASANLEKMKPIVENPVLFNGFNTATGNEAKKKIHTTNAFVRTALGGVKGKKAYTVIKQLEKTSGGFSSSTIDPGHLMSSVFRTQLGIHWIGEPAMHMMFGSGDPISGLSNFGHKEIPVALGSYFLFSNIHAIAKAIFKGSKHASNGWLEKFAEMADGGAMTSIGLGILQYFASITKAMLSFALMASLALFVVGLFFAYYLPAVPFILWISAVVGWLILVLESMVAAPLWAVAHMMPSDQGGLAGPYGRTGWMLFFNILIRPPLMVMGFFMAVIIMGAVGYLVEGMFMIYYAGAEADHHTLLIGGMVMPIIAGVLMVILTHKVFGLIVHLPREVPKWIGQMAGSSQLGEEEAHKEVRGVIGAVGSRTEGGLSRSASGAGTMEKAAREGGDGGSPGGGGSGEGGSGGGSSKENPEEVEGGGAETRGQTKPEQGSKGGEGGQ